MASLITRISDNFGLVTKVLEEYEIHISNAKSMFELDGKKIESLCKDHPKNLAFYKQKSYELKSLEEFFDIRLDKIQSEEWKRLLNNKGRSLSTKDIQQYILSNTEYITMQEIRLEVVNVKRQIDAIVQAFEDMGWMLSHMTKLRVAELEDSML